MNLYEMLGVSQDATKQEISEAYRKKAKELHPDAGGSNDAFIELKQISEILLDDKLRMYYDDYGIIESMEVLDEASKLLTSTFVTMAKTLPLTENVIMHVCDYLRHTKNNLSVQGQTLKKESEHFCRIAGKISSNGIKNYLADAMNIEIAKNEANREMILSTINVIDVALRLSEKYSYRNDVKDDYGTTIIS